VCYGSTSAGLNADFATASGGQAGSDSLPAAFKREEGNGLLETRLRRHCVNAERRSTAMIMRHVIALIGD